MANIMIVDYEIEILDLIEVYLQNAGHNAIKYNHPAQALENDLSHIDLAVLDVMMPDIDGFSLCRQLRDKGYTFPIIMLTAKDDDKDKINGLVLGADDYMVKPFNPQELVARIGAQLRRITKYSAADANGHASGIYDINGLVVNEDAHTCTLYGKKIDLTPIEFGILLLLCKNRGKVMSSETIFETVWGEKYLDSNNTVIVHVQNLRHKLEDTGKRKKFIQTVWGVGYKINE